MSYQSDSIRISILGGQILALREAVLTIYTALQLANSGAGNGDDLDEAIYAAVDLLPAEMRPEGLPPRKQMSAPKFEDLL